MLGALLALLSGVLASIGAVLYKMRLMEKRGEFRDEKPNPPNKGAR